MEERLNVINRYHRGNPRLTKQLKILASRGVKVDKLFIRTMNDFSTWMIAVGNNQYKSPDGKVYDVDHEATVYFKHERIIFNRVNNNNNNNHTNTYATNYGD